MVIFLDVFRNIRQGRGGSSISMCETLAHAGPTAGKISRNWMPHPKCK